MFWEGQDFINALYLVAILGWGLILFALHASPGLVGVILDSYRYKRSELVDSYVARFFPIGLFALCVDLGRGLLTTLILIVALRYKGLIPAEYLQGKALLMLFVLPPCALLTLKVLRHWTYKLWSYVFMPKGASSQLARDYGNISLLGSVLLMPSALIALSPKIGYWSIYALVGIIALSIGLRILQALRRLVGASDGYIYIFLYLCTLEVLPWSIVATAIFYGLS